MPYLSLVRGYSTKQQKPFKAIKVEYVHLFNLQKLPVKTNKLIEKPQNKLLQNTRLFKIPSSFAIPKWTKVQFKRKIYLMRKMGITITLWMEEKMECYATFLLYAKGS